MFDAVLRKQRSQPFVKSYSNWSHASSNGKDKWGKGTVLKIVGHLHPNPQDFFTTEYKLYNYWPSSQAGQLVCCYNSTLINCILLKCHCSKILLLQNVCMTHVSQ